MNHLILYAIAVVVVLTIGLVLYFATRPPPFTTLSTGYFPNDLCKQKIEWMNANYLSNPFYEKEGADGTDEGSLKYYLKNEPGICPSQTDRQTLAGGYVPNTLCQSKIDWLGTIHGGEKYYADRGVLINDPETALRFEQVYEKANCPPN